MKRLMLLLVIAATALPMTACTDYSTPRDSHGNSYEDGPESLDPDDVEDWLCSTTDVDGIDYSDC